MLKLIIYENLIKYEVLVGHSFKKWEPAHKNYFYGILNKQIIIDLAKTLFSIRQSIFFIENMSKKRSPITFCCDLNDNIKNEKMKYFFNFYLTEKYLKNQFISKVDF